MAENQDKQVSLSFNDPQSPYYLNSADHPGYIISPVTLNGDNYGNWSRLIINALKSKNKLGFVDGTLRKPASTSPEIHAWEKCDSMVTAWLYNVIDKSLHGSVAYANTARTIWIDLEERYSQPNAIRVHQLKRELSLVEQDKLSVTEYFTKLKSLWDELGTYQILPVCTCDCKCGKAVASMLEQERVHQFLMGLDHVKYNTVRSNILSQDPLPTLNKAYAAIVREERQLQFTQSTEPRSVLEGAAFKATQHHRASQNRPKCSHCQKMGHERHQCYELNGYPANWGNRRSNRRIPGAGYGSESGGAIYGGGSNRSSNHRNWGSGDKTHGAESGGGMTMDGAGGGIYQAGCSNFASGGHTNRVEESQSVKGKSLGISGEGNGGERTHRKNQESMSFRGSDVGFAGFTAS